MRDEVHCHFFRLPCSAMAVQVDQGDPDRASVVSFDARCDTARQVVTKAGLHVSPDQLRVTADWPVDMTLARSVEDFVGAAVAQGGAV